MTDKIQDIDLAKKMKKSYLDYSMAVIISRALPDVRDGLKPVHRRILYGADGLGLASNKPYRKSARLVGEVMGKYHPHGDVAIYDAQVKMAQDFAIRYPLMDGQGNYGSIDGDNAAAMRYTEVKMTPLAEEMLRDIKKNTVSFNSNFDGSEKEPSVLPSRFPNLLVNGSTGIAVGMSTKMAPHNLNEVIDGCVAFIDNPNISLDEMMKKHIKAPDFPTGGTIFGLDGVKEAYKTGRGRVVIRANIELEKMNRKQQLVITDIPYTVNKADIIKQISTLINEDKLEDAILVRDESSLKGIRIVVELKQKASPKQVINNIYKNTKAETNFNIINLVLVDYVPKELGLLELIDEYVKHQKDIIYKRTVFELEKLQAKLHILRGLAVALDNIDEVVRIIRTSKDDNEIADKFFKKFKLDRVQTNAILAMQLRRLAKLEKDKVLNEIKSLEKEEKYLKTILNDEKVFNNVLKEELLEIKEKYGDERRSKIVEDELEDFDLEDLIKSEDMVVTATYQGNLKKQIKSRFDYPDEGLSLDNDDYVVGFEETNSLSELILISNKGNAFKIAVTDIEEGTKKSRPKTVRKYIDLEGEKIVEVFDVKNLSEKNETLVLTTSTGLVKRVDGKLLEEEMAKSNRGRKGFNIMPIEDGAEIISCKLDLGKDKDKELNKEILVVVEDGRGLRFKGDEIRIMGRTAKGIAGIKVRESQAVSSKLLNKNTTNIVIVTDKGLEIVPIDTIDTQGRGGVGKRLSDNKIKFFEVLDKDDLMLLGFKDKTFELLNEKELNDIDFKGREPLFTKVLK